jgi:uncharacterized membrane protein YgcG
LVKFLKAYDVYKHAVVALEECETNLEVIARLLLLLILILIHVFLLDAYVTEILLLGGLLHGLSRYGRRVLVLLSTRCDSQTGNKSGEYSSNSENHDWRPKREL